MKKLYELHCKDGAGTVDIKNVNKTVPLYRDLWHILTSVNAGKPVHILI